MYYLFLLSLYSLFPGVEEHLVVYGACSNRDLSRQSVDPGRDSNHPVQHDADQGETRTDDKSNHLKAKLQKYPDLWPWAHANLLCNRETHGSQLMKFTRLLKFYIRSVNAFSPGSPVNRAGFSIQSIMDSFHSVLPCEKKQHKLFMHCFIDFHSFRINTSTQTAWLPWPTCRPSFVTYTSTLPSGL